MLKRHYRKSHRHVKYSTLLSFLDGLEGGFAIFAGIVVGLSFCDISRVALIVSALIGIFVNAVNAATIRYSTEHYLDELDGHEKHDRVKYYLVPALFELLIYIVVSSLSLLPLLFIDDLIPALICMLLSCVGILFVAGAVRGHLLVGRHWLRDGFEVTCGGIIMIAAGTLAGFALSHAF